MPNYWVIAPYQANKPEIYDRVWKFDLQNGCISIGWRALGDVSQFKSEDELYDRIAQTYRDYTPQMVSITNGMLAKFYRQVQVGDIVLARRGTKRLAAIGTVKRAAYFDPNKTVDLYEPGQGYSSHLDIVWDEQPRNLVYDHIVFGMQTIYQTTAEKVDELKRIGFVEGSKNAEPESDAETSDEMGDYQFTLEKHLQHFLVNNFATVFNSSLKLMYDPEGAILSEQYPTEVGTIDILAQDNANNFVVIELKKGNHSDKVVGQILRYMGWVKKNLCRRGQGVRGIIICHQADEKLRCALTMTQNIQLRLYKFKFELQTLE